MPVYKRNSGFTFIELSIVLIIIGIMLSVTFKLVVPINQIIKSRETKERLDTSIQSAIGYASTHNAIMHNLSTVSTPSSSWGKNFIYLYDNNFYSPTPTKDTICGRRSAALNVHTRTPDATTTNVAFAIVSSTEDFDFKSDLDGTLITTSAAATGTLNIDAANKDMVRFVTVDELRAKIGCQGAPLKILNNELPAGVSTVAYTATIMADGGVPFTNPPSTYKFCVNSNLQTANFTISGASGFFNADCTTASTATWIAATSSTGVIIGFTANTVISGTYPVTIVVRDNTGSENQTTKNFVITVNP